MTAGENQLILLRLIIEEDETGEAAGQTQGGLEGFGQPLRAVGPDAHAIDHRFDGVLLLRIELRERLHLVNAAVDADAHKAL